MRRNISTTRRRTNAIATTGIGAMLILGMFMTSCRSTLPVQGYSENLTSLTKITDSPTSVALSVGGSADYNGIFVTLSEGKNLSRTNVYKKDSPVAPAFVQVTKDETMINDPSYCMGNDRIAFSKYNGTFDVFLMPTIKGNALIPVTETDNANERTPSMSQDGSLIVYQKTPGLDLYHEESEIWLKNLKTGETMLLGKGATPSISPDGSKIAFTKFADSKTSHIWIMDVDGSNARQISGNTKEFATFPAWNPQGDKIVYQRYLPGKKKDYDLFVVQVDGGELKQITNNKSQDVRPFWSPDGNIYFISDRGSKSGKTQVWRFGASSL